MKLTFEINNQILARTDKNKVVADSRNYLYAEFSFLSEDWNGITKTAIFRKGNKSFKIILDEDNTCIVPWEVLECGTMFVSVFGGDLITTNSLVVSIMGSGYSEGETPSEPTPDVYTQIIRMIDNLESGNVSDEQIAKAVEDYLAENPVSSGESNTNCISRWNGKTLCAFGTSITYRCSNGGGYLKVLQDTLGLASYTNNGLDGNAIAYVSGREGISRKVQSTDITDFDIITIEGCTNDFKLNVPIGEVGAMGDTDFDESVDFCQALRKAIESILTSNPEANILLVADPQRDNADYDVNYTNSAGHKLIDYVNAMIQIGALYAIPVCDLYRNSGINQYTLSAYTSDGLHPNSLGYKRIGNVIASSLENMYSNTVIIQSGNTGDSEDNEAAPETPDTEEGITTVNIDGIEFDISGASGYTHKMIMKLGSNYYIYVSNNPFYVYDKTTYAETFYAEDTQRSGQATAASPTFGSFSSISSHGTSLGDGYKYMTNTRTLSSYKWTSEDILYYGTEEVAVSK